MLAVTGCGQVRVARQSFLLAPRSELDALARVVFLVSLVGSRSPGWDMQTAVRATCGIAVPGSFLRHDQMRPEALAARAGGLSLYLARQELGGQDWLPSSYLYFVQAYSSALLVQSRNQAELQVQRSSRDCGQECSILPDQDR